jgi:Bacteriophage CI repressor helix-turn-helix domain
LPKPLKSFADAIDRFPRRATLARAIGISGSTIRSWHRRDSIPPEWFAAIGEAAQRLGVALTERQLRSLFQNRLRDKLGEFC